MFDHLLSWIWVLRVSPIEQEQVHGGLRASHGRVVQRGRLAFHVLCVHLSDDGNGDDDDDDDNGDDDGCSGRMVGMMMTVQEDI